MTHKKGKNYISTNIFYPARRGNHFACTRPSERRANTHAGPQLWWKPPVGTRGDTQSYSNIPWGVMRNRHGRPSTGYSSSMSGDIASIHSSGRI